MNVKDWLQKVSFFVLLVLNCWIFQFQRDLAFRDFSGFQVFLKNNWLSSIFSVLKNLFPNLNSSFFWNLFFALIFTFAVYSCYFCFRNIAPNLNKSFIFALSVMFFYNPFTLERFLMGQYFVLLGMAFCPIFFWFLWNFFNNLILNNFWNFETFKNSVVLIFCFFILQFFSLHHGYVAIYIFLLTAVFFLFQLKQIKISSKNQDNQLENQRFIIKKTKSEIFNFKIFNLIQQNIFSGYLNFLFLNLLIFISFLIIFWLRFLGLDPVYASQPNDNQDKLAIINFFSLKFSSQNWQWQIVEGIIGKGSWMQNFQELADLQAKNSTLASFSIYFNDFLIYFYFLFLISIFLISLFASLQLLKKTQNSSKLNYFLFLTVIFMVLNFGSNFLPNLLFYNLPGFYVFRESGKFYSLAIFFLLLSFVTFLDSFQQLTKTEFSNSQFWYFLNKKTSRYFLSVILVLIIISNFMPFLALKNHLNYISLPEIYQVLENNCQKDEKIVAIPNEIYTETEFSQKIYIPNPIQYLTKCELLDYSLQSFVKSDLANLGLLNSQNSEKINNLDLETFKFFKENKVRWVLVNGFESNPKIQQFQNELQTRAVLKSSQQSLYLYYLP
jgi:hypothetical protein